MTFSAAIEQIATVIVLVGSSQRGPAGGTSMRSNQMILWETKMAKGQVRSNREIRKPKKAVAAKGASPAMGTVTAAFAKPDKGGIAQKKR